MPWENGPGHLGAGTARYPWRRVSIRRQRWARKGGHEGISEDGRPPVTRVQATRARGTTEHSRFSQSAAPHPHNPSRKAPRLAPLSGSEDRKVTKVAAPPNGTLEATP